MDVMFLNGKTVLNIVDTATIFLNTFEAIYGPLVKGICLAFVQMRCKIYISYPNRMQND